MEVIRKSTKKSVLQEQILREDEEILLNKKVE